eukprot:SAG31_NODE_976_length_10618_cov_3.277118_6_plen_43_part_00
MLRLMYAQQDCAQASQDARGGAGQAARVRYLWAGEADGAMEL